MLHPKAVPSPVNGVERPEDSASTPSIQTPDPEVVPRAKRKSFTTAYKLGILSQADRCIRPGQIGALLRSEGLYSSYLTTWRRQREGGELGSKKQGKPQAGRRAKANPKPTKSRHHNSHSQPTSKRETQTASRASGSCRSKERAITTD